MICFVTDCRFRLCYCFSGQGRGDTSFAMVSSLLLSAALGFAQVTAVVTDWKPGLLSIARVAPERAAFHGHSGPFR
jgi:hypothetical protein